MWNNLFIFLFQRRKGGPQIKPSDKFKNNMCFGFCFLFVCLFACFEGVEIVCLS